jgi:hypothetical protein
MFYNTVILRVYELIVITTCEYPINRFANPEPALLVTNTLGSILLSGSNIKLTFTLENIRKIHNSQNMFLKIRFDSHHVSNSREHSKLFREEVIN